MIQRIDKMWTADGIYYRVIYDHKVMTYDGFSVPESVKKFWEQSTFNETDTSMWTGPVWLVGSWTVAQDKV